MAARRPLVWSLALLSAGAVQGATNLTWNAGADERIRHEIVHNLPRGGRSGRGIADGTNWIRFRTRVWGELDHERFRLYLRLGNENRWYPTDAGPGGSTRNWRFPDELYVDNLYLDLKGLFDGWLDLRAGRQDFLGPEAYGSKRIIGDGTPGDDSRTDYFDAIRARIRFTETEKLDVLAIWNNDEYMLNWGDHGGIDREPNTIVQGSSGLTECGGGLYHRSRTLDWLPADAYWIYKHESPAFAKDGGELSGRDIHTFGTLLKPKFTKNLGGEFELAWQTGARDTGAYVGGHMAYAALDWDFRPGRSVDPWVRGSCYYMSGDKHRDGEGDTDYAWDPVWARWPQFSDLWVKTFFYGIAYWSNLIYPAMEAGLRYEGLGSVKSAMGPLFAAVDDGAGHGDGGCYIGWLSSIQVEVPIVKGLWQGRGDVLTHVRAEFLNPSGDYLESTRPACYFRWDVTIAF